MIAIIIEIHFKFNFKFNRRNSIKFIINSSHISNYITHQNQKITRKVMQNNCKAMQNTSKQNPQLYQTFIHLSGKRQDAGLPWHGQERKVDQWLMGPTVRMQKTPAPHHLQSDVVIHHLSPIDTGTQIKPMSIMSKQNQTKSNNIQIMSKENQRNIKYY